MPGRPEPARLRGRRRAPQGRGPGARAPGAQAGESNGNPSAPPTDVVADESVPLAPPKAPAKERGFPVVIRHGAGGKGQGITAPQGADKERRPLAAVPSLGPSLRAGCANDRWVRGQPGMPHWRILGCGYA